MINMNIEKKHIGDIENSVVFAAYYYHFMELYL